MGGAVDLVSPIAPLRLGRPEMEGAVRNVRVRVRESAEFLAAMD